MMTSVEIKFNKVVEYGFHETLIPLGFKRNRNNFYSHVNGIGHIINVQKSIYSSIDHIEFTINAGIFLPEFWSVYYNDFDKPVPEYPRESECILRMRIGDLRKEDDIWYDIYRNTNEAKLIKEMKMNVREFILPHFGRALSKDMIVDLMDEETPEIEPFEKLIVFMVLQQKGRARKEYERLIGSITRNPNLLERIKGFGNKYGLL